jgi:hypothetical protein
MQSVSRPSFFAGRPEDSDKASDSRAAMHCLLATNSSCRVMQDFGRKPRRYRAAV